MRNFLAGMFVCLLLVAGLKCVLEPGKIEPGKAITPVEVIEDKPRGVVCYIALRPVPGAHEPAGISCMYDATAQVEVTYE